MLHLPLGGTLHFLYFMLLKKQSQVLKYSETTKGLLSGEIQSFLIFIPLLNLMILYRRPALGNNATEPILYHRPALLFKAECQK